MVADMASTTIEVTDSTQVLRVRRLKKDFPLHQVNAAILQAVRKLGYDRPTEDQRHHKIICRRDRRLYMPPY